MCGGSQGSATCWCAQYPPLLMVPSADAKCLCAKCLARAVERRLEGHEARPPLTRRSF